MCDQGLLFRHLLLVLLVTSMIGSALAEARARGVQVQVKDAQGQVVGLYEESHALLIGVSDYTAGWPDLPGVREDL